MQYYCAYLVVYAAETTTEPEAETVSGEGTGTLGQYCYCAGCRVLFFSASSIADCFSKI